MVVSSVSAVPASLRTRTLEESTHAETVTFPAPSSLRMCTSSRVGEPVVWVPSLVHSRACASNSSSAEAVSTEDRSVARACSGSVYASHRVFMTKVACPAASASVASEPDSFAGPPDCGVMVFATDCGMSDCGSSSALCAPDAAEAAVSVSEEPVRRRKPAMTSAMMRRIAAASRLFLRAGESELMKSMCIPSVGYRERLPRGSGKVNHE